MADNEMARREIEDLWWLRHCLEAMTKTRDINATIRVGVLRSLLATTEPETSTTDPRDPTPPAPESATDPSACVEGSANDCFRCREELGHECSPGATPSVVKCPGEECASCDYAAGEATS